MYGAFLDVEAISERHTCKATHEGDWIIHRCPKCDYELWDNWKTGDLKIFNAKENINHTGFFVASEKGESFEKLN
jgi:hypothetical protein